MATLFTRPATSADSPAVSRICLLTGDKGQSAEGNFKNPEMLGLVYAEPYVNLTTTVGFVLVSKDDEDRVEKVVGYILGAPDTRAYEKEAESVWWPPLREKYPLDGEGTEHDKWFYKLIHKPDKSDQPMIDVCEYTILSALLLHRIVQLLGSYDSHPHRSHARSTTKRMGSKIDWTCG
jgi:hypothetical protein